jgi:protein TonB
MKYIFLYLVIIAASGSGFSQIIEADTQSEFPGGMSAFYDFVSKNIQYPKQAQKSRIVGIVFVEFYVDEQGHVNSDSVHIVPAARMREVAGDELADQITSNKYLEKEALRVIKTSPAWIPAKENGKPIAEKIVFPVSFDKDLFTRPKKNTQKSKIRMA